MVTKFVGVLVASTIVLTGCSLVTKQPFTEAEHEARTNTDKVALFAEQQPIEGAITLEMAIARALKYNLDHRLKLLEDAVALDQLDIANLDLLPSLAANAGYSMRSNNDASFNEAQTSTSTSSDKKSGTGDLTVAWSLLDFGVSYYRAKQQADLANIVAERRRQVVQNIVEDTRRAYWNAVAAQRAGRKLEQLEDTVLSFLENTDQRIEAQQTAADKRLALQTKRGMLDLIIEFDGLKQRLSASVIELNALMNMPSDVDYVLADSLSSSPTDVLSIPLSTEDLELTALRNRSELRNAAYELRITQQETKIAILQMIPGISFDAGVNTTTDSFKPNQRWYTASADLTWNLMNVLTSPTRLRAIETEAELNRIQRLALSMAVISQVNVAKISFTNAVRAFETNQKILGVEDSLVSQTIADVSAGQATEMDKVGAETRALRAILLRDLAYADMQSAFGRIFASIGADPVPDDVSDDSLASLAVGIGDVISGWPTGRVKMQRRELVDTNVLVQPEDEPAS